MKAELEAFGLVVLHFKDIDKAKTWWYTDNPLLGHMSPYSMIELHNEKKLLKFVKQQLSLNIKGKENGKRDKSS